MNASALASHDRLLASLALVPACQRGDGEADWFPPVDILEDAEEYLFRIDLPEMDPGGIRVTVEGDDLLVSGERPTSPPEAKSCLRIERAHGYFERRFTLPDDASRQEIDSALDRGVLELHVRKVRAPVEEPAPVNASLRLKVCWAA